MMLVGIFLLITLAAPVCWFVYHNLYKQYLDCQVPLEQIDSVVNQDDKNQKQLIGETAIIIGGSFSGLSTAIILSKYYKKVIIVDRSKMIPNESIVKSRQGDQAHVVAFRALQVWDRLLPGFLEELKESLKKNKLNQIIYPASHIKYLYKQAYGFSDNSEMRKNPLIMASRGQIESLLRDRIKKELKNVEFLDGFNISSSGIKVESISDADSTSGNSGSTTFRRVKSVTLTKNSTYNTAEEEQDPAACESQPSLSEQTIECDLLVNCAGSNSHNLMKELESAISPPQSNKKKSLSKSSIECKIRYQTILMEPKDSTYDSEGRVAIYREDGKSNQENRKLDDPYYIVYHLLCYPNRRGILLMPYTDNLYLILLATYNEKIDPVQFENAKEQIMEFSKVNSDMERDVKIMLEKFQDTPKRIHPVYEKSGSEYVHYEHLKGVKDFIAVGDSCGSLNPIYGQGVTMAVDSAVLLDDLIKQKLKSATTEGNEVFTSDFCQDFQSRICKSYLVPWLLCSTTDLRFDFSKHSSNLTLQKYISPMMGWMTDRMFMSAHVSSVSSYYFMKLLLMEDGFRKELINLRWLFGYVFWKESLAIAGLSLSIYLSTWL